MPTSTTNMPAAAYFCNSTHFYCLNQSPPFQCITSTQSYSSTFNALSSSDLNLPLLLRRSTQSYTQTWTPKIQRQLNWYSFNKNRLIFLLATLIAHVIGLRSGSFSGRLYFDGGGGLRSMYSETERDRWSRRCRGRAIVVEEEQSSSSLRQSRCRASFIVDVEESGVVGERHPSYMSIVVECLPSSRWLLRFLRWYEREREREREREWEQHIEGEEQICGDGVIEEDKGRGVYFLI